MARGASPEARFMRKALQLAQRACGMTSPNPMVGAVLVKADKIIGQGFHQRAGGAHAEIQALRDAKTHGHSARGGTLYVTLEPCCTHGRTPPCTDAIIAAGIRDVVVGAVDPNPQHSGRGLELLRAAGVKVLEDVLGAEATRLNEAFNHWIVHRTPFVTVKAGMSLDGKIATRTGESKWITSSRSRERAMRLRHGADAILVGANTVLRDDPRLTVRLASVSKPLKRFILDSKARIPASSRVVADGSAFLTTIVVGPNAPADRVAALERKVQIWRAPSRKGGLDLRWLLKKLGAENVTSLLVEGGGEINASFILRGFAHRVAFFYAPLLIGGGDAVKAVAGGGILDATKGLKLNDVNWERLGPDLLLTARLESPN